MTHNEQIEKIRIGGQDELGKIYTQHRNEFLHWIRKEYHCSDEDSKDIYQLSILIFYDNIKQGKLQHLVSSIKTYLFGIGKNIMMENFRKASRQTPLDQVKWLKEYLLDEADETVPEKTFEVAQKALEKLGEPCSKLVSLFYFEKKTIEEIAQIMDYKNSDTTKNLKYKCMNRLRKLFEEEMRITDFGLAPTE